MPVNIGKTRVLSLYKRLFHHYGHQHWWPARTAWEMMVGAILTQNTAWTNVEKAISALKSSRSLSVRVVATMPRKRLEKLIRPSGYFRQKAERLQGFANVMVRDWAFYRNLTGRAHTANDLRCLRAIGNCRSAGSGAPLHLLRNRLLSLRGIGPETADSILLYAARKPVFVVDAYTRRIGQRLGLFKTDDYHDVQAFFQNRLPRDPALYNEFHALLVRLAKEICTKRNPRCTMCPVKKGCLYHRRIG
jgi:endonuclease-3 related protein